MSDWPDEETNEPLLAGHRNFYKSEIMDKDVLHYADNSPEKRGKSSLQ